MVAAMLAAPLALVVSAVILGKAERPALSVSSFVGGAFALDLVFAALVLGIYRAAGVDSGNGDVSAWIDVVLGVIFAFVGGKTLLSRPEPGEQAAQRARVEKIASAKPAALVLAGVAVQVINADAMTMLAGGLKEIATENPYPAMGAGVVVVLGFLFVMLLRWPVPRLMYLLSRGSAAATTRTMSQWLLDHARALEIVVGLAFGVTFL